ncbi:MAG: hypothetical protein NT069_06990 [Planctomycetota bacterium]|nr:hypothetical protein [Planctomycetota bacterium]
MPIRPRQTAPQQQPASRCRTLPRRPDPRPAAVFRQRLTRSPDLKNEFSAPERWHEPRDDGKLKFVTEPPGKGYVHVLSIDDVRQRIAQLPREYTRNVEVVQFSGMTRKRASFPCYGMQWGRTVYLYAIEETLIETYYRPPSPQQKIEARMFGGEWRREGSLWRLVWNHETIRDFYLNNVLIHEIGHVNDDRNSNSVDRERYANWFAIEYGYRATRSK